MKRIHEGLEKGSPKGPTKKSRFSSLRTMPSKDGTVRVVRSSKEGMKRVYKTTVKVSQEGSIHNASFDKNIGLILLTDAQSKNIGSPEVVPQFEVIKSGHHTYQLKTDALKCLNFTDEEIYSLVVPKRTLARRVATQEPLSVEETDKAVRLGRIDRLAAEVFGDASKAHRWLRKPKQSLGGETPLACLSTEVGARAIEEILNQIDHGISP
jgi:putative toxin-antitoxin system antitoxin component (TIGR02293 family)